MCGSPLTNSQVESLSFMQKWVICCTHEYTHKDLQYNRGPASMSKSDAEFVF